MGTGAEAGSVDAAGEARQPDGQLQFWAAWDEFFAALRRARARAAREQADGLTIAQYRLLDALEQAPGARAGELAEQIGCAGATVTRLMDGLEEAGLLRRERVEADRRGVCVRLTADGRRVLAAKRAVVRAKRGELYASLSPAERAQAERLFRRFAGALDVL